MREHDIKQKKCPYNGFMNCIGKECVAWEPLREHDWTEIIFISKILVEQNGSAMYVPHESDIEKVNLITERHERVQTYGSGTRNFGTNKIDIVINETWAILEDFKEGMELGECSLMCKGKL